MQADNKNNDFLDDKFFDQAWSNMKETLDKEMPEEKERRRFLPWFFLITGGVIGFLVWNGLSFSNPSTSIDSSITENYLPKSSTLEETLEMNSSSYVNEKSNSNILNLKNENKREDNITPQSSIKITPTKIDNIQIGEHKPLKKAKRIDKKISIYKFN